MRGAAERDKGNVGRDPILKREWDIGKANGCESNQGLSFGSRKNICFKIQDIAMGMRQANRERGRSRGSMMIYRILMSVQGMDKLLGYYINREYTEQEKGDMLFKAVH